MSRRDEVPVSPNGLWLSGARERVRCSRGLGHERLLGDELKCCLLDFGSFCLSRPLS